MGCRISSSNNENLFTPTEDSEMATTSQQPNVDYKARLERKQCLAKETPEPIYDLEDCNLKDVPAGVFVMCKVLRKEALTLSKNKLSSLAGGGTLDDLVLLQSLNLSYNRFKKLPEDIYKLENLRELFLANNALEKLPIAIGRLKKLELLNLSANNLATVEQLAFMTNLRVLDISGNVRLSQLPSQLATCDNLVDIVLDPEHLVNPPPDVVAGGTYAVIKYLSTGEVHQDPSGTVAPDRQKAIATSSFLSSERNELRQQELARDRYEKERKLLERERLAFEKDVLTESKLHEQQQRKKQVLLQQLLEQQSANETQVHKLQQEKQTERERLIDNIIKDEQTANELVNNLLALKNGPDPAFLEQEREEQKRLLEHLHIQQNDLRKQEILGAMTNLLENEINIIQNFHNQRDQSSRSILEREYETNNLLNNVFLNYDRNRQDVIDQITCNEDIQKSAVAALIARNDSRTWGLVEQVRIVESQLAALTLYEIERKKVNQDDQIINLTDQRINLTYVLTDLLKQQDQRKQQLLDTLKMIEKQKESEQTDFWLLQYQRLLDRQPVEVSNDTASIDPVLGYQFLVNGVVHCLPFLSKLWQNKDKELCNIADQDLLNAGVQNPADRQGILQSIANYYDYLNCKIDYPEGESVSGTPMATAPSDEGYSPEANGRRRSSSVELGLEVEATPSAPLSGTSAGSVARGGAVISSEPTSPVSGAAPVAQFAECVVCMEQLVQVIFLPCGHMCCCSGCHVEIHDCPMCRAYIERKIKVIQP
ncbi:E3 ubiquitin-protein ligase LRSAM1-like isoform X1 [Anopheles merus]|uniref:E3 ubiquitin-protein ligase LRSAM1-like isoform X1 n=2 Tax=Anopheles merus TaxID=30066 RepID=UPI001BE4DA83|nr:E3 ubiquitin-protein ligase LRSAM1-like isoform X1 [Anopheles merus]XP_041769752.1 E3 ubiquitin-protein ligase LRSAM1-like isoform X1 [Anopheles merus]